LYDAIFFWVGFASLALRASDAKLGKDGKTVFCKNFRPPKAVDLTTAFLPRFALSGLRSARPTWQSSLSLHEGIDIQQVS
jgi:hypothetical protein